MSNRFSFVSGASSKPLIYQTIGNSLHAAAQRFPRREALFVRHQDIRWSYEELNRRGYVRFVDEFPMTATGKLQKFIMRDRMIQELGLTIRETA